MAGLSRQRLPTLEELLASKARSPVDLYGFYIYMRDQQRSVDCNENCSCFGAGIADYVQKIWTYGWTLNNIPRCVDYTCGS